MTHDSRGAGDRWLAGEAIDGVTFGPDQVVELAHGPRVGEQAVVLLLVALEPEPMYRVLARKGDELHVRQSALRAAEA